jgi:hypothetical protein
MLVVQDPEDEIREIRWCGNRHSLLAFLSIRSTPLANEERGGASWLVCLETCDILYISGNQKAYADSYILHTGYRGPWTIDAWISGFGVSSRDCVRRRLHGICALSLPTLFHRAPRLSDHTLYFPSFVQSLQPSWRSSSSRDIKWARCLVISLSMSVVGVAWLSSSAYCWVVQHFGGSSLWECGVQIVRYVLVKIKVENP